MSTWSQQQVSELKISSNSLNSYYILNHTCITLIHEYTWMHIFVQYSNSTHAYSMGFRFNFWRRSLKLKAFLMNAEKESQAKDTSNVRYVHWIHRRKLRWQWEIMILVGIRRCIHLQFFKCVVFPLSCQFFGVYFSVPIVWVCWEVSSFPFSDVLVNQQLQVMDNEDMDVKVLRTQDGRHEQHSLGGGWM